MCPESQKKTGNFGKCRVMHCGRRNRASAYTLTDSASGTTHPLEVTTRERDLGIILTPDMKSHDQVTSAVGKASRMTGMFKKSFKSRAPRLWKKLYTATIRPHLEFAAPAWNPHLRGDVALLERAQRRVTRIPRSLRDLPYEERCERLGLTSLEARRLRGDLIQQFKIVRGIESVDFEVPSSGFVRVAAPRGGKRAQLRREIVKSCSQRHNFLSNRIVCAWNDLPNKTASATTTANFKKLLDTATAGKRQGATS